MELVPVRVISNLGTIEDNLQEQEQKKREEEQRREEEPIKVQDLQETPLYHPVGIFPESAFETRTRPEEMQPFEAATQAEEIEPFMAEPEVTIKVHVRESFLNEFKEFLRKNYIRFEEE